MLDFPIDPKVLNNNDPAIDSVIVDLIHTTDLFLLGRQYTTVTSQSISDTTPYIELIANTETSRRLKSDITSQLSVLGTRKHRKLPDADVSELTNADYVMRYQYVNTNEFMMFLTTPRGVLRSHVILG